jgi:hypothetical protein
MACNGNWDQLSEAEWRDFAEAWLAELREKPSDSKSRVGQAVVSMNFSAASERQWDFILLAVSLAETEEELGHIAAGPIEHLLGWHGKDYIERVEEQAAIDPKFTRTMLGVWQYKMTEEIWSRVQAIQECARAGDASRRGVGGTKEATCRPEPRKRIS